ncbi:MAG: o-succinylbenzoate synthase [Crocinitomicaceae bacterium]|nr:o-succinylbenzoate synthase [Crocinitomicaceae bacterium]
MKAKFTHFPLTFKRPASTSRGVMNIKNSWILSLEKDSIVGTGEISIIEGLSDEFVDLMSFESTIHALCDAVNKKDHDSIQTILTSNSSIRFAYECAMADLKNGGLGIIFNNDFYSGKRKLPINGLIWMGSEDFMKEQIDAKLLEGFSTIKMKVGAIDFEKELELLHSIRKNYSTEEMTLRVDANGSFEPHQAVKVLEQLAELEIHSIEQPIKAGQWGEMRKLCSSTPTPIALDEELIGINNYRLKIDLLETIQPHYIILKPSLHGGISGTQEWISLAEERSIPWWMTSALESNIGLSAICQLTAEYSNELPQGLGTGSLYTTNVETGLIVENGFIYHN